MYLLHLCFFTVNLQLDSYEDNNADGQYKMAVFGAGERTVFDKVKPVLEASFSNVMYTGGIGTAMIPKVY